MKDLTIIIPVQIDSKERLINLKNNVDYLNRLGAYVVVIDSSSDGFNNKYGIQIKPDRCIFKPSDDGVFRKSKLINEAVREIETEYFAMIDADAIFGPSQIKNSYSLAKSENCIAYPYSGVFVDVEITSSPFSIKRLKLLHETSVGGGFVCSKKHFFEIGGMNENFVSWGYEDDEFHYRAQTLSKVKRWSGECLHQTHPRGSNSSDSNPFYEKNRDEYERIMKMSFADLQNEIKSWQWCQKKY